MDPRKKSRAKAQRKGQSQEKKIQGAQERNPGKGPLEGSPRKKSRAKANQKIVTPMLSMVSQALALDFFLGLLSNAVHCHRLLVSDHYGQFGSDFSERGPERKLIGSVIFGFSELFLAF